jgi:hypothetical protein
MNLKNTTVVDAGTTAQRATWLFSWPLMVGMLVYFFLLLRGYGLLRDDDTYLHIATGQWIFQHRSIPTHDPFSHTMPDTPWTAHEWLSQVLLASAHDLGGWTGVVAITALAFAAALALLTRALLKSLEPVHALMFAALALFMTANHLHARPHILAMPLVVLWAAGLVQASESGRAPSLWLLPVMTLWANLHGGFTLGLALAFVFALEALLACKQTHYFTSTARSWALFIVLAITSALITPHGIQGISFTWQFLFEQSYALARISEWQSPDFHMFQPLEIWLLCGLALVMHKGFKLPPIRLLLLLGLLHLALQHVRHIELLGLLAPLFFATPFAAQWRQSMQAQQNAETVDRFFRKLATPAGKGAVMLAFGFVLLLTQWIAHARPPQPPDSNSLAKAIRTVHEAGVKGPVLNYNGWGGYLIYAGIPPFIDGRSDMYKDDFLKEYLEALALTKSAGLEDLLAKYKIGWTLLQPGSPAVALLDHLPNWHRLYADEMAVVHVRTLIDPDTVSRKAIRP